MRSIGSLKVITQCYTLHLQLSLVVRYSITSYVIYRSSSLYTKNHGNDSEDRRAVSTCGSLSSGNRCNRNILLYIKNSRRSLVQLLKNKNIATLIKALSLHRLQRN